MDTSKEFDLYADFKDIPVSSSLVVLTKSYEPENICLIFGNRGNP